MLPAREPADEKAVAEWVASANATTDRFADVYRRTEQHRHAHRCELVPSPSGPVLATLSKALGPLRILEVGTGLGYSALSLAWGARGGLVDTLEQDESHAAQAAAIADEKGFGSRVTVFEGRSALVLPTLRAGYDLAHFDGDARDCVADLEQFERLLRMDGLLVSAGLFPGLRTSDPPYAAEAAAYRARLLDPAVWTTSFLPGGVALSLRL